MPPRVQQKWLNEMFQKLEPMPEEVYGNPDGALRASEAISLKRIADSLEKLNEQTALLLRIFPR